MADERLSNQDLEDLAEIKKRLPAGDPRHAKIDALVQATNATPTEFERDRGVGEHGEQPGVLASAWNTVKKMPEGMMRSISTGASMADPLTAINDRSSVPTLGENAIEGSRFATQRREEAGRSGLYQAAAPAAEMLGVDVQGMEDAAEHANPRGVIGSAIGSAAPYLVAPAIRGARAPIGEGLKKTSYGIYNNVLGTKGAGLAFEGNPGRGVAQEGLVAGSRPRLLSKINDALETRGPQINEVLDLPQHRAISMDITEPVTKPFSEAIRSGTKGASSDATLSRLTQAQKELTLERSAPGEYTGQPKKLSGLNPLEANNMKREIQGRTNYQNPENDEVVNNTLRSSAGGVRNAVHEAVPDVIPFDKRVQDLSGARSSLANRINRRMTNPGATGFKDVAPGALGLVTGGPAGAAVAIGARELLGGTGVKTLAAKGLYKTGNLLSPDAPLRIPEARPTALPTPIRGLLGRGPIRLGSSMEPIDSSTSAAPSTDWTTRAVRTGRLLPERTSIDLGSHMEPIEDVGPMSQPAASVVQRNPRSGTMQKVFTTSSKLPRPIQGAIQLPESPYGFGPEEEESEIERARRR